MVTLHCGYIELQRSVSLPLLGCSSFDLFKVHTLSHSLNLLQITLITLSKIILFYKCLLIPNWKEFSL